MKRPILFVLAIAVFGVIAGFSLPFFMIFLSFIPFHLRKEKRDFFRWIGILLLFIFFFLRGNSVEALPPLQTFERQPLTLLIDRTMNETAYYYQYSARVIEGPLQGQRVLFRESETLHHIGEVIKGSGVGVRADRTHNDGLFSYESYLMRHGFSSVVRGEGTFESLGFSDSALLTARRLFFEKVEHASHVLFDSPYKELFISVLTGRTVLEDETESAFASMGIAHLLAVSGLHVGILFGMVLFAFGRFFSKNTSRMIALILLFFYAWIIGFPPSVFRATVMCFVFVLSKVGRKPHDSLTALSLSIVLILAVQPASLFDAGLHLSVAGVWSVIWFAPQALMRFHGNRDSKILFALWIQLGILPATLYHFSEIPWFSFFINLISIPLFSVLMTLGTPLIVLQGFGIDSFLQIGSAGIEKLAAFFLFLIDAFQFAIPWKITTAFTLPMVLWSYALFILLIVQPFKKMEPSFLQGLFKAMFATWVVAIVFAPRPDTLTAIDIGQGDAFLLETKEGAYLFDTGGEIDEKSPDSFERILSPVLQNKGISSLAGVFISHTDADHIENLDALKENFTVDRLFLPAGRKDHQEGVTWLSKGDRIQTDDFTIDVIHDARFGDSNDSMVLKLTVGQTSILFTGDLESAGEQRLLQEDLTADILKVSHHGSAGASTKEFLDRVDAKDAIVSVGYNNMYGHPTQEVLDRLEQKQMNIYRTDMQGNIQVKFTKNSYTIKTYPVQEEIGFALITWIFITLILRWMCEGVNDATTNFSKTITKKRSHGIVSPPRQ